MRVKSGIALLIPHFSFLIPHSSPYYVFLGTFKTYSHTVYAIANRTWPWYHYR